jgi:hypothetical protein
MHKYHCVCTSEIRGWGETGTALSIRSPAQHGSLASQKNKHNSSA